MTNETKKTPQQQKPQPGGSVNAPDTKTNPTPGNQNQSNPQEVSKKTPSQGGSAVSAANGSGVVSSRSLRQESLPS